MIKASRCKNNHLFAPPRAHCPRCRRPTEEVLTEPRGTLLTFTTLYAPPAGFSGPRLFGLVLLEGGELLFCLGGGVDEKDLVMDMKVEILFENGLYVFRPGGADTVG